LRKINQVALALQGPSLPIFEAGMLSFKRGVGASYTQLFGARIYAAV